MPGNKCGHTNGFFRGIYNESKLKDKLPNLVGWAFDSLDRIFRDKGTNNSLLNFKNGRKIRSESREAILQVSKILFSNLEFETMTVVYNDVDFRGITYRQLTKKADISLIRIKRAIKKLKDLGLISVTRIIKKKDSLYTSLAAIKQINFKFFDILGLGKYYRRAIEFKIKKNSKSRLVFSGSKTKQNGFFKVRSFFKKSTDILKKNHNDSLSLKNSFLPILYPSSG